jgi:lipopolysaccharide biosynthesis glycosyltransferase
LSDETPALPDLHVVTASDRGYVPYVSAMLTSLRYSLPPARAVHVTVLSRDLKGSEISWPNQGSVDSIRCFAPDIPVGSVLPIGEYDHLSVETYYRLVLESAFDDSVQRVIYLDADLVVLGDLSDLAAIDLGGKTVGAVMDFAIRRWGGPRTCEALKSQRQHADRSYFNAGVLVIDLDAWRRKRVRDLAVRFLFENQGRIHCWDQDALNHALGGDWCELDPRWNRMCYWERQEFPDPPFSDEVMASLSTPNIVHFTGRRKPWNDDRHEARSHFDKYVTMAGFGSHRMTWLKGRWLDMKGWLRERRRRYTLRGAVRRIKRVLLGTAIRAVVLL